MTASSGRPSHVVVCRQRKGAQQRVVVVEAFEQTPALRIVWPLRYLHCSGSGRITCSEYTWKTWRCCNRESFRRF